MNELR